MSKLLQVAEDKLIRLIDTALKAGGLAVHNEVQSFLQSIQKPPTPPAEAVVPTVEDPKP